jgi:hypothetical protein
MSALPPIADIKADEIDVCQVPQPDTSNRSKTATNMAKLTELLTTNAMHVGQGVLAGTLIADLSALRARSLAAVTARIFSGDISPSWLLARAIDSGVG